MKALFDFTRRDGRSIVLVGMMGAGKSAIGRLLAASLKLPFIDADTEIEAAAGETIVDIFANHGEAFFRSREERVIERLLSGPQKIIGSGGGAFIHPPTRARLREGAVTVWLKAEFDVLWPRLSRKTHRPLMNVEAPESQLRKMIEDRYPVYAQADVTALSTNEDKSLILARVQEGLVDFYQR